MLSDEANVFPAINSKFEFVEMSSPVLMKVRRHWAENGYLCSRLGLLDVHQVDIDILKRHDIWDKLNPEVQNGIENRTIEEKQAVLGHMEKMRGRKRQKYVNVPRAVVCITCKASFPIAPGLLVKRAEKIAADKQIIYTVEDYLKSYECQECHPTKGRKANPAFASLPRELECNKCHAKMAITPSGIAQRAKGKGLTPEEFLKQYQCQVCNPTRGRHFKGKKRSKKGMKA